MIVLGLLIIGVVDLLIPAEIPASAKIAMILGNVLMLFGVSVMLWYMGIFATVKA